jgi:mannose-6-phosphate isomerase-like protein (cupin superfamily)
MTATASTPTAAQPLLARFKELVSYQSQHAENGIPREVMQYLAANQVFPVVCPPGLVGRNALAPLRGWPGLCITIAQCTPQQGPVSHNHTGTLETFFCLDGRFDVLWGNALEHKVTLEPGDLCSVPPNVYRTFRNLTDQDARLLVLIQGDEKMSDKIEMPKRIGEEVRQKHGDKVMELLAGINMRFQGEDARNVSDEEMGARTSRVAKLQPRSNGQETVYPVMDPQPASAAAPVKNWPGLSVAMLQPKPGEESSTRIAEGHSQWVINVGDVPCEVSTGEQRLTLHRFDMLRVEPGATRTVRNVGSQPARVLLATQTRETIQPDQVLQ